MAHTTFSTTLTLAALSLSLSTLAFTPAMTEVDGRSVPKIDWTTTLNKFQMDIDKFLGQRFTAMCPKTSKTYRVGDNQTGVYSRKQAICQAGLGSGAIDEKGGLVTVQLIPDGMSVVGKSDTEATDKIYRDHVQDINWDTKFTKTGYGYKQLIGQRFTFNCPAAPGNLRPRRIVGTDSYEFKTMICRAAVHAGKLTMDGGLVTVQMNPKMKKLVGSTRNGIETKDGTSGLSALTFVANPVKS